MNTLLKFVLVFFVAIVITYTGYEAIKTFQSALYTYRLNQQSNSDELKRLIQNSVKDKKGNYSFFIQNITTGETFSFQSHRVYQAASLYKLWIMALVYKRIQNKFLSEETILSEKASTLNDVFDIPEETAEQTEGEVTFSVGDALRYMITASDNSTALLLTHSIGRPAVRSFLRDTQLIESVGGIQGEAPRTTASDIGMFFYKLYNGDFANTHITEKMIDLLKKQELNDSIPKYLPSSITVAHKTGEIEFFAHDAGIVYTPFGDYIFVGMTETSSPSEAKEQLARVSLSVYEYFKKTYEQKTKEYEESRKNLLYMTISIVGTISGMVLYFLYATKKQFPIGQ